MPPRITSPSFFIGQEGNGILSFGSGQPDLPPPQEVFRAVKKYKVFRYGLIQGETQLRSALAREYPDAKAEHFIITNGASEALDLIFRALSTTRGKVLLPKPYYYSYPPVVRLAGMEPIYYTLQRGKIDFADFTAHLKGCVAVLINSPSNPTGSVQEISVLKKIESFCTARGIYVISDEVYKDLIYVRKNYLIQGHNVITVNSFSKTYALCGLRVGYLYTKNRAVAQQITEMKTHTSMNTNILGQAMALEAMHTPKDVIRRQTEIWKERRDLIYNGMVELGLDVWKPEGAFYVFPKFRNPNKVVNELYYHYKMITYDGTWFGDPTRVRFSYALDTLKIKEGLARLTRYLRKSRDV